MIHSIVRMLALMALVSHPAQALAAGRVYDCGPVMDGQRRVYVGVDTTRTSRLRVVVKTEQAAETHRRIFEGLSFDDVSGASGRLALEGFRLVSLDGVNASRPEAAFLTLRFSGDSSVSGAFRMTTAGRISIDLPRMACVRR